MPGKIPSAQRNFSLTAFFCVLAAVCVFFTMSAAVVSFMMPETYCSTARIKVERDLGESPGPRGQAAPPAYYDPYFIQTEFELMQSELILGQVIRDLDLNTEWGKKYAGGEPLTTHESITLLKSRLEIRLVRDTTLIEIRVFSDNPEEAARIANGIASSYRDYGREQRAQLVKIRDSQAAGSEPNTANPSSVPVVEIIDRAVPGLHPVRPNKPLNIVLGAMLGILVGLPIAAVAGWLARRRGDSKANVPAAA